MATIDEKLKELTARDPRWAIWPAGDGSIVLKTEWETYSTDRQGDGLETLVDAALAYVPLPVIPRKPRAFDRHSVAIRKSGNRWEVSTNLGTFTTATKRKATETIDRFDSLSRERIEKWETTYGPLISAGQEGVDFRYEN